LGHKDRITVAYGDLAAALGGVAAAGQIDAEKNVITVVAGIRVATWRSPESVPARMPAPGRTHLVICACRAQSDSGSNGTMPRSCSSRTALPRALGGKSLLEKEKDLVSPAVDCIGLRPDSSDPGSPTSHEFAPVQSFVPLRPSPRARSLPA
jgi:hypothetical protein